MGAKIWNTRVRRFERFEGSRDNGGGAAVPLEILSIPRPSSRWQSLVKSTRSSDGLGKSADSSSSGNQQRPTNNMWVNPRNPNDPVLVDQTNPGVYSCLRKSSEELVWSDNPVRVSLYRATSRIYNTFTAGQFLIATNCYRFHLDLLDKLDKLDRIDRLCSGQKCKSRLRSSFFATKILLDRKKRKRIGERRVCLRKIVEFSILSMDEWVCV